MNCKGFISVDPNWVTLDLNELRNNASQIRRRIGPNASIIASLKGDAYGHGVVPAAAVLERCGISGFMLGSYGDAMRLRQSGSSASLVMFASVVPQSIPQVLGAGLIPTIVDITGANSAASFGRSGAPARVYVKVDAGFGRLGVPIDEAQSFLADLAQMSFVDVAGLYTHLPFADAAEMEWARPKYAEFDRFLSRLADANLLPPVTQAGASSSVLAGVEDRSSAVGVGRLLFGFSPFTDSTIDDAGDFKPVISEVGSRLVQVTSHAPGQDMAIADVFGATEPKRIGVAPIGVANGLQRPAPGSRPTALVRGRRVPILAVSLEHLTVDLDSVDDAEAGDRILLLGADGAERIDLEHLASWFGLSDMDTVQTLSGRLRANYIDGD